jgi:hypothetical protein
MTSAASPIESPRSSCAELASAGRQEGEARRRDRQRHPRDARCTGEEADELHDGGEEQTKCDCRGALDFPGKAIAELRRCEASVLKKHIRDPFEE